MTLDNENLNTFSSIYLKLILEIGSEVDNIFREICGLSGRVDISDYAAPVFSKYPAIVNQFVSVNDSSICISPFSGWNTAQPSQSLSFWNNYNSIKHDRITNYKKASLETTINALAGLFILLMYRIDELYKKEPNAVFNYPHERESKLFYLNDWGQRFRSDKIKSNYPIFDDSDGGKRII